MTFVSYDEVHIRTTAMLDGEDFLDQNRFYVRGAYVLGEQCDVRLEES